MSGEFKLNAETRADLGKGASRRLRRLENRVLGIVYGGKNKPSPVTVAMNEIVKLAESEAFFTSLVDLSIDGKAEQVVVKDMQRHPAKETIMHVDFLRVDAKTKLTIQVPLHFINEEACFGVKMEGGTISHALNDIEVSCLPKDLPEYIEVDMAELKLGENIHLSDLTLPKGVESVALSHGADHDLLVSAVNATKGGSDEEEAAPEEAAEGEGEAEGGEE
ncbi:50S ribosomal protein L25/general stress protein Ctc [Oceanicoccus sagamiensis]|nr:50S ribosomal protein L25/general stress protein Ctc [Oceanicoccus sagamiensis]